MRFNKKICIPVLVIIAIIPIAVYVVSYFNKTQYVPISFNFDAKTREVVFLIDEGYKIHRLQMLEGNISVPNYESDTREIQFPTWQLSVGEHEFVYFVIQNNPGKVTKEYTLEYEILHQSTNEIIISVRKSNSPLGKKDVYTFYYDNLSDSLVQ